MEFEIPITIDRPVSDVFRFFADEHVRNHPRWDTAMKLEQVTPGPVGVGTVIRRRANRNGKEIEGTMRVVEFQRDRALAMVVDDGPMHIEGRTVFEALGPSRTKMTMRVQMPVPDEMAPAVQTSIEHSVSTIKRLLEDRDEGPPVR